MRKAMALPRSGRQDDVDRYWSASALTYPRLS
jgi:hypothetical protein